MQQDPPSTNNKTVDAAQQREPQGFFHPCVRLFNAERLYYILIQSLEAVPEDRNEISGWLKDTHLDKGATIDIIFGEADMLLRVWADAPALNKLMDKFLGGGQHQFKIVSILLVNDMDVTYQRTLESGNGHSPWNWNSLQAWLDKVRISDSKETCYPDDECLLLPSSKREGIGNKQKVRFWVFCEGFEGDLWRSFEQLRQFVLRGERPTQYGVAPPRKLPDESSRANIGRKQLQGVSIYSYETIQSHLINAGNMSALNHTGSAAVGRNFLTTGVLIKGEFDLPASDTDPKYQNLMENFSYFVHEVRNQFGIRTVTYLSARHLFHEKTFKPANFNEIGGRRKQIVYSLLKTPESASFKLDGIKIPSFLSDQREAAINAREERIVSAVEEITSQCYAAMRILHPTWWEHIAHARDIFRWMAAGNNEALMGTMSVRYPMIENRLRALLKELGEEEPWLQKQESDLKQAIGSARKYLPNDEAVDAVYKKVRKTLPTEKHITYRGIEEVLQKIVEKTGEPKTDDEKRRCNILQMLVKTLALARTDRNKLLHGDVADVFAEFAMADEIPQAIWHTYVINYLRLYLTMPLAEGALSELIEDKRSKQAEQVSRLQSTVSAPSITRKVKQRIYCFNWPGKGRGYDGKLAHTLELLRDHYELFVIPNHPKLLADKKWFDHLGDRGIKAVKHSDLPDKLDGWAISLCNTEFLRSGIAEDVARRGLRIAWGNEMMMMHEGELAAVGSGLVDVMLYVSDLQREVLEPQYADASAGKPPPGVIVGDYINPIAFGFHDRFSEAPKKYLSIGRLSWPDEEKFPENFPEFYAGLGLRNPEFKVMDWNQSLTEKWGRDAFRGRWAFYKASSRHPRDFLQSLDLFVYNFSATYRESFGRVVVEAMLTGAIPLIPAGNEHHLHRLVEHSTSGFHCASDVDYGEKATWLEHDVEARRRLSRAASEHAREIHCKAAEHIARWQCVFER